MRKWYIFDHFDCLSEAYDTASEAAQHADEMAKSDMFPRLEIRHFTKEELDAYIVGYDAYKAFVDRNLPS